MVNESLRHANTYSVWISTGPASSSNSFIYVGSEATIEYNINYQGTIQGILGEGTGGALFIDGTGGAVGNVRISGAKRANPKTTSSSNGASDYQAWVGVVSNKEFIEITTAMMGQTQMLQNAFILRLYGLTNSDVRDDSTGYKDLYFFMTSCNTNILFERPNEISVDITGFVRNIKPEFGGN